MIRICLYCQVGLLEECANPQPGHADGWIIPCGSQIAAEQGADRVVEVRSKGAPILEPDELTNDTSAGRKRAAMLAPIMQGMTCEWAGLKFAGGGPIPIVGCEGNTIAKVKTNAEAKALGVDEVGHLHHGPDKAVLNNAVGVNLHRICTICHNRWHAANDKYYAENRPHVSQQFLPLYAWFDHDSRTRVSAEERAKSDLWWETPVANRGLYPFVSDLMPHPGASKLATANPFETSTESTDS